MLGQSVLYTLFGLHSNSLISLFIFLIIFSSFFLISDSFFLSNFSNSCSHHCSILSFFLLIKIVYFKSAFFFISCILYPHFLSISALVLIKKKLRNKITESCDSLQSFLYRQFRLIVIFLNFKRKL